MDEPVTCRTVAELRDVLEQLDPAGPVEVVVDGHATPAVVAEELYTTDAGETLFGCTITQGSVE